MTGNLRLLVLVPILLAALAGCTCDKLFDQLTDDMVRSARVTGDIAAELKVMAQVGISIADNTRTITVRLPRDGLRRAARPGEIEAVVRKHFPEAARVEVVWQSEGRGDAALERAQGG